MENLEEFAIPEEAIEKLNDPAFLKKHIEQGRVFQDLLGYSNETMESFYRAAYKMFERGNYKGSADAFIFLTTLNPYVHNYWMGLAMCEQKMEEYEASLVAYGMSILIEETNPISHYHSATCYEKMGDIENAIISIDQALLHCHDDDEYAELKKFALLSKQRLQNLS